jgi:hypothetical protein
MKIVTLIFIVMIISCTSLRRKNLEAEKEIIDQTIKNSIDWASNKNKDFLCSVVAHDSDFFIFHPDTNTILGYGAFKKYVDNVLMDERFKATAFEVKKRNGR